MKRFLISIFLLGAGVLPAVAGTITGTIRGAPPVAPEGAGGGGAYDSRRYKYVEKLDYDRLRDFVIYIDQPMSDAAAASASQTVKTTPASTTQRDANFEPHVLPVVVNTAVRWPNEDDIYHNVFSMAEGSEFDLGYYKRDKVPVPEVVFTKVGKVDVFCAIHTKMHCIILVLPNALFAMADEKGRFTIKNVPAGTYKLKGWHERLPSKVTEIVVPAEGEVKVDLVLGLGELPKR
jgi:plastocyanin